MTAAAWVPDASLADASIPGDPRTTPEVTWAALDCPGGWAVDPTGRPMVLGTMTTQVTRTPRIGVRHVVVGQVLSLQGRKARHRDGAVRSRQTPTTPARAALSSSSLGPSPRASAIWIAVDPASDYDL